MCCYQPSERTEKVKGHVADSRINSSTKGYSHIQQEVVDSLIATRSAYEPTSEGVAEILQRKYDLHTGNYELLYHREQPDPNSLSLSGQQQQVFVIVRSSNGYVLVACRGTFTLSDVFQDVKVGKVPMTLGKGKAHYGFLQRAMGMPLELFISLLRAGEKIIFTGHSLGGAVASLITLRVLEAMALAPGHVAIALEQVRCITFGTAPFANLELSNHINSRYRDNFHHLVSKHDVVPRSHNVVPNFFFPAAKWFVGMIKNRWEVKMCKRMVESMAKMPLDKAVMKLEERVPALWPATGLFNFVRECAAQNEEELFFGLSGYVLLLDPDSTDPSRAILVDEMESLGTAFCLENKNLMSVYFEHGLRNHYDVLVHAMLGSRMHQTNADTIAILARKGPGSLDINECASLQEGMTMKELMANPSRACLNHLNRVLLRVTGNELPPPSVHEQFQ